MADHLKIERVGGFAGTHEVIYDGPLSAQVRQALEAALRAPAGIGADIPSLHVTITRGHHREEHQVTDGSPEAEALLGALSDG